MSIPNCPKVTALELHAVLQYHGGLALLPRDQGTWNYRMQEVEAKESTVGQSRPWTGSGCKNFAK